MMNRGILAIVGFIAVLIVPVLDAYAGPVDRIRKTDCGVSGCVGLTLQEDQRDREDARNIAKAKKLEELYSPKAIAPPSGSQDSITLKFDKDDPLYQLLMRTLIEESEARKDAATGAGKTGP